jgi:iron complex transport system ATP-binding protein
MNKESEVFCVDRVSFHYPRSAIGRTVREQSPVFENLTVSIASGQMLGVIGPNGSGKSTLLKLLAGIVQPQKGMVSLFGGNLRALSPDAVGKMLAYVPQEFEIAFPFTVQDIVLMGRYPHRRDLLWDLWGWESSEDYAAAGRAMTELNVLHLAEHAIGELSGGERQRALIARALAQEPAVLILDEPTAFLDLNYQLEISRILHRLVRERSLTIVLVSHDLNLASQYCDRLLLLDRGKLAALDHPRKVLRPELLEPVYGCRILIDCHPETGLPRVSLPGRPHLGDKRQGGAQPAERAGSGLTNL